MALSLSRLALGLLALLPQVSSVWAADVAYSFVSEPSGYVNQAGVAALGMSVAWNCYGVRFQAGVTGPGVFTGTSVSVSNSRLSGTVSGTNVYVYMVSAGAVSSYGSFSVTNNTIHSASVQSSSSAGSFIYVLTTSGSLNCRFITINGSQGHLAKPATEFHIAYFFAQPCADAGPGFGPYGGTLWGRAITQFFRASQDDAPFAQLFL